MSSVDVIVVSYNSRRTLRRCVAPLASTRGVNVVVVDNASRDGCLETLGGLEVGTIALDENRGFATGCNVGAAAGTAPYLLFLNPDASLDPGSLETLAAVLDERSEVGAVAPRIEHEDGSLEFSLRRFPRLASTYASAFFLHRLLPSAWTDEVIRDKEVYAAAGRPEWVSGACMLVRRSAFEAVGGFDEGFFMYCEDKDLCKRLRDAGYEIAFEPRAVATHEGGASAPRAELLPVLATSRVRYAHKHDELHVAILQRIGVAAGAVTHALFSLRGPATRRGYLRSVLATTRSVHHDGVRPSRTPSRHAE